MDLTIQLKTALQAIQQASKIVMDVYHKRFDVQFKEDQSEVTIADLESDRIIRKILQEKFPNDGFLSEETKDNQERLNKDFCWIIDPLDGTKDFVNHTNEFSINIALSYKHEIILGVIAIPYLDKIYYATYNQGAYKIEKEQITKIHANHKTHNLTLMVSNFFFKDKEFEKIPNNHLIEKKLNCGSAYKACQIAEGIGEVCIKFDPVTKEWDTAASEIIIKEAGGYMCDLYGNPITYNKKDVYNRNGFIIANQKVVAEKFILKQNKTD